MTPSILTWQAHGSPKVAGRRSVCGGCYLCAGSTGSGVLVEKWMGDSFTSQTLARCPWSQHVCEACAYVASRISPVLGRDAKEGKKFGGNFRNYSCGFDEIGYWNASKGEKPMIRAFLEREHTEPWFLCVADSGQKHIIPFARMNGPGRAGVVSFDEQTIDVPADVSLTAEMAALLTLGVTKDELGSRDYYARSWKEHRAEVDAFEARHGAQRGGGWFTLALWLAQRDNEEHARRETEKEARDAKRRDDSRAAKRVLREQGGRPPMTYWTQLQDRIRSAARQTASASEWASLMQRRLQIGSLSKEDSRALVELVRFCDEHGAHSDFLAAVERDHSLLMALVQLIVEERKAAANAPADPV
jgi:hypothetical protein